MSTSSAQIVQPVSLSLVDPMSGINNKLDITSIIIAIIFVVILLVAIFYKSTTGFWAKVKKYSLWLLGLLSLTLIILGFVRNSLVVAIYGPEFGSWSGPDYTRTVVERVIDTFMVLPRVLGNWLAVIVIFIVGIIRFISRKVVKRSVNTPNKL